MNERYGYGYGQGRQQPEQQPQFLGYDDYGQPVYGYETYDQYGQPQGAQPQQGQGQGQGPGQEQQPGRQQPGYDQFGGYGGQGQPQGQGQGQQGYAYDPYGQQTQQQPPQPPPPQQAPQQPPQQQEWVPQQAPVPPQERYGPQPPDGTGAGPDPDAGANSGAQQESYHTEEFAFVEEEADDSEDVIDWLKFTESRTERREEARRRGRNRVVALVLALVLIAVGGVGYLWYAGKLPGVPGKSGGGVAAAGQQRDVIVVHLRSVDAGTSSTALLVDNSSTKRGNTVLLPNSLAVSTDDGATTTLGKSVVDQGAAPTRDALNTLLGADVKGTWRLDTPYLENLVELVGGITVDTDATVPGKKKGDKPQVTRGAHKELDGRSAVAYSTYRAPGEPQTRQLERFGQVMQATLKKLPSDPASTTRTVHELGQIPDVSLSESALGASLAKLAAHAKGGSYRTGLLPVLGNGTLSRQTSAGLVKQILGGTVKNSNPSATPRVKLSNASGRRGADKSASAALVNGGYNVVNGGTGQTARTRSAVTYSAAAQRSKAQEVAKTLGLPGSEVRKGESQANADVAVVLGRDYKG